MHETGRSLGGRRRHTLELQQEENSSMPKEAINSKPATASAGGEKKRGRESPDWMDIRK